jgi:RNA polymerase sigma-70 factor (ECF subfamily)
MFPNTEWTNLRGAITTDGTVDPRRIESLCSAYYKPISAFIRSICPQPEDAEDLTQDFMIGLAQGRFIVGVDPSQGKFRAFLCQCARNFARTEWQRRSAIKRGGGAEHIEFDEAMLEAEDGPAMTEFDRAWVTVVVDRTLAALRETYSARGRGDTFELLVEGLGWTGSDRPLEILADEAGMSRGAFATARHRLRASFRERVRAEVRKIVCDEDELEEEICYYLTLFASSHANDSGTPPRSGPP